MAVVQPRLQELKAFTAGRTTLLAQLSNIRNSERTPILLLLAAVGVVLVIACSNVAGLTVATSAVRQRDFALRLAIGASRGRLARSLLLENALLSALAAIAGAWLAYFGVRLLVRLLPSQLAFFNANEIRIDGRVLLFTTAISVVTVLATGLLPARRRARGAVSEVLKYSGRSLAGSPAEGRTCPASRSCSARLRSCCSPTLRS